MNMNWLNTNYILRAGVLSVLLLLPGLISATCKADTIINSYKDDSLRFIIKDDSDDIKGDSSSIKWIAVAASGASVGLCTITGACGALVRPRLKLL